NLNFIEENNDTISFDECLQLLAETFPVEETGNTSVMTPEQPSLLPTTPAPVQQPPHSMSTPSPAQQAPHTMSTDLEQAWMELLSLPELQ
ncbi:hypothetical protein NL108_007727, partial [Boleophthalmus pectinirostris]